MLLKSGTERQSNELAAAQAKAADAIILEKAINEVTDHPNDDSQFICLRAEEQQEPLTTPETEEANADQS